MAAAGTYYIDTINFANANEVFLDEALTTCAPNGFYQMGGATAREQVDCVGGVGGRLLDPVACPSCTPPSQDPPIATNTSYKVTDVVTSVVAFVAITNTYQPTQKITTNLSTNCWLINNESTDAVTATITGSCNIQPVLIPQYYLLNPCPNSLPSSDEYVFTYVVDSATDKPPINGRYLDTTTGQFYTSANTAHPQGSSIPHHFTGTGGKVNPHLALQGSFPLDPVNLGCPPPPERFCYWNATPCSGGDKVIIKMPTTVFDIIEQGTSSVKVSGTCYTIDDLSLCTNEVVSNIGLYDGTVYSACDTGLTPCIPAVIPFESFVARENTTNVEYDVKLGSGNTIDDNVEISAAAGCYKLVSRTTRTTNNTITLNPCTTQTACAEYEVSGNYSYVECLSGNTQTGSIGGDSFPACAQLNTATSDASGYPIFNQVCFEGTPPTSPYNFWNMEPCSGGTTIRVRTTNNNITANSVMKLDTAGNPCYKAIVEVGGDSFSASTFLGPFTTCNDCAPVGGTCFGLNLIFNSNTNTCPTGNPNQFFADTNDLSTATKLYAANSSCLSSEYALTGTYNDGTISRYWSLAQGSFVGGSTSCGTPSTVRATISEIVLNIEGSTQGYSVAGIGLGSYVEGVPGFNVKDAFTADSDPRLIISPGFAEAGSAEFLYSPSTISSDQSVILTITAIVAKTGTANAFFVIGCGIPDFFTIGHDANLLQGTVVLFRTNSGVTRCGSTGALSTATPQGTIIQIVPGGCDTSTCVNNGSDFF